MLANTQLDTTQQQRTIIKSHSLTSHRVSTNNTAYLQYCTTPIYQSPSKYKCEQPNCRWSTVRIKHHMKTQSSPGLSTDFISWGTTHSSLLKYFSIVRRSKPHRNIQSLHNLALITHYEELQKFNPVKALFIAMTFQRLSTTRASQKLQFRVFRPQINTSFRTKLKQRFN